MADEPRSGGRERAREGPEGGGGGGGGSGGRERARHPSHGEGARSGPVEHPRGRAHAAAAEAEGARVWPRPVHVCPVCSGRFADDDALEAHRASRHPGIGP